MVTVEQKVTILELIRTILPTAKYAPKESWIEPGEENERDSRHKGEAVHFASRCGCDALDLGISCPCELTIFITANIVGQGRNLVARMENALGKWAKENLVWEGCGDCKNQLVVDVRLFPTDSTRGRKPQETGEPEEKDVYIDSIR